MVDIGKKLHPLERKVLPFLDKCKTASELVSKTGMQDVEVTRALQWLSNKKLLKLEKTEEEIVDLDENGANYKENGLPEKQFLKALEKESELSLEEIHGKSGLSKEELNVGMGQLRGQGCIGIKKEGKELFVKITDLGRKKLFAESLEEKFLKLDFPVSINSLKPEEKFGFDNFKKRKKIIKTEKKKETKYVLTAIGKKIVKEGIKSGDYIERLTPALLKGGKWKGKDFRAYDVSINVPRVNFGKKHFVNDAFDYIRKIWMDMGFQEMTGNVIQTGFWNLDALFVPQDHPAREMQDTFYLKNPSSAKIKEKEIYKRVKSTHENGWTTGSKGWQSAYSQTEAERLMLRTHTTVLSALKLAKLKKKDLPAKFFNVGKVYRNEALDWKHLFEFHQVDGIVIDPDANFSNLVGYLKRFFRKMGFTDARVRPGHFPYTEPSAEVDVYDPVKKQWIELGGAGIFRPEVTKPLLGFECPVLAWGLGLERIITDYYGIKDLREIYKNDLDQLRKMRKFVK